MRISDKEKKDIESIIFSFQEWADRYRIKTNHNILCELTGLKKPIIELVMQFQSIDDIKLNIEDASPENRDLAVKFARSFDSIDDETRDRIIKILSKKRGD